MLFLVGLDRMSPAQKAELVAGLEVLSAAGTLEEAVRDRGAGWKQTALRKAAALAGRFHPPAKEKLEQWDRRLQWETGVLEKRLEKRVRILKALPRRRLRERLRSALCSVAGCAEDSPDPVIIHGVLNQAAKTLSLDPARYLDAASLEQAVFEKGVERKLHQMQESLRRMSPRDLDACEQRLERDLDTLGSADRESLRSLLGLEKLSGPALIGILRTTSSVALAQLVVGSMGFAPWLFLSTSIKAVSVLLGVTFSIGFYHGASSLLAGVLSLPFTFGVVAFTGGWAWRKIRAALQGEQAIQLVLAGRMARRLTAGARTGPGRDRT